MKNMKKQEKMAVIASAAALFAVGGALTSYAATGWTEEDGQWYYYDKDGNRVEDVWKKSGDNWYWLDSEENGAMAIDKLIEDDDDIYYVDSNGAMVRNTWVKVVNEDQDDDDDPAEYNYYYMQSTGKAYKTDDGVSTKTIDGKRYAFNDEGKMLYGWVDEDGEMHNAEDDWQNGVYYFGSWDDGSMKTGWQRINVLDEEGEKNDNYDYWFNFKSNGKKRTHDEENDTWKSGSKYYHFDERGVMVYEWYQTNSASESNSGSNASASNWSYFNSPEDGAKVVKGWFKVIPPTEDNSFLETETSFAASDSTDESELWYYNEGYNDGLVAGEIRKIHGKYYAFWQDDGEHGGRMLTGLCALVADEEDGSQIEVLEADYDTNNMDSDDLDDFLDDAEDGAFDGMNVYLYYFGSDDDQDTDGAMKTGNTTINLDGESYSFLFRTTGGAESKGRSVNGIDDGKYIYQYGLRIKADSDEKYIAVLATGDISDDSAKVVDYDSSDIRSCSVADINLQSAVFTNKDGDTVRVVYNFPTDWYLVNTSGTIQDSKKTGIKDGDEWYWYVNGDGEIIMYTNNKELDTDEADDIAAGLEEGWDELEDTIDSDGSITESASCKVGSFWN